MNKDRLKVVCVTIFGTLIATLLLTSGRLTSVRAFSTGPPAGVTGAPGELTCSSCHTGPSNTGQFTIEAPSSYVPGATLSITVRHTNSDTSRRIWGFQLTALTSTAEKAGALQNPGGLGILNNDGPGNSRQYIQQTLESNFSGQTGGAQWTFDWVAPSTNVGPVTLYAAGNQGNNNGVNTGDQIYTTTVTINPPSAGLPTIDSAAVNGKKLIVSGSKFDIGAELLLDGKKQKKVVNDDGNPSTMLIAKKAGKTIDHGATVTLQVRNLDGTVSDPFTFTRP
ncbi:MAG TPA: choice-of-anchor V domain-containing protein [Blastocatellia bacterium]|jgi:hypothetical protein|nr:choice-of-anchor V domain-containing protein [Blastocatellia bacterium]